MYFLFLFVSEIMIDETNVHLTFHEWLANVTEQINQSMHYQFDGG